MSRIEVTIHGDNGTFWKYEIPQGDVEWEKHAITTCPCPCGNRHLVGDTDSITISWPMNDPGIELETNDPKLAEELQP